MPIYEYLCDACGTRFETMTRGDRARCAGCGAQGARRRFSFRQQSTFPDHFNQAVGAHVTNERDFKDRLKKAGEEASIRTGIDHVYEPIDYSDRAACGITDDHIARLEETKRREAVAKSA
jgi:putative FmdB family regulatory protein